MEGVTIHPVEEYRAEAERTVAEAQRILAALSEATPPDIAHTHPDTYALSDANPEVIGAEERAAVTVIQADRDAAADVFRKMAQPVSHLAAVTGLADDNALVQAFARHRQSHSSPAAGKEKEARDRLRSMIRAAEDMLTGISVHNALDRDAPSRLDDIKGSVVSELAHATMVARGFLRDTEA